jgi:D-serine deaminase-like pyridoxal phosphate-dependent protein
VDAAGPLQQLADAAAAWGTSVDVLVEVNVGQDRCDRALPVVLGLHTGVDL